MLLDEEGGYIKYYDLPVRRLAVRCPNLAHGRYCIRTRVTHPIRPRTAGSGRAIGELIAFYLNHDQRDKNNHLEFAPDLRLRKEARAWFTSLDDSHTFLDKERDRRDGEESEPDERP
jgi:hypothetical protein